MQHGHDTSRLFEKPCVSWRNGIALVMGPRQGGYSARDGDDLTEVEIRSAGSRARRRALRQGALVRQGVHLRTAVEAVA